MIYIIGFIFVAVLGTLLHFTYDLSGHNKIVGLFSAVNESTWEHLKIAIMPTFLWSLVDGYFYGMNPNYFFAKLVSIVSMILVILVIFYGIKLIFKKSFLVIDILSFYIAIFIGMYLFYLIINMSPVPYFISYLSLILVFIIFGISMLVTLLPIKNFIFRDPITLKYGFRGHLKEKVEK